MTPFSIVNYTATIWKIILLANEECILDGGGKEKFLPTPEITIITYYF